MSFRFFLMLISVHFGQNQRPFGCFLRPTHSKWNHSTSHCGMQIKNWWAAKIAPTSVLSQATISPYDTCESKFKWHFRQKVCGNSFADTISRFIGVHRHVHLPCFFLFDGIFAIWICRDVEIPKWLEKLANKVPLPWALNSPSKRPRYSSNLRIWLSICWNLRRGLW